jgi:CubicO group peptidase (beta-lactamase class C family)
MNRRILLQCGLGTAWAAPLIAAVHQRDKLDVAADVLTRAAAAGQVDAAVLYVRHRKGEFVRSFGHARSPDDLFLLGSISKPMTVTA